MLLKFTIVNEAEKNDHPVAEKYSLYKIVIKVNFLFYKSARKVNRLNYESVGKIRGVHM